MYEEHVRDNVRLLEQCLRESVTHVAVQRVGASLSIRGYRYGKDQAVGTHWPNASGREWYLVTPQNFVECEEPFLHINPSLTAMSYPFAETV